jgi:hypothetical protein
MESRTAIINCNVTGFGPSLFVNNPMCEPQTRYYILNVLDENDESFAYSHTFMQVTGPNVTNSACAYLHAVDGTITTSVPTTPASAYAFILTPSSGSVVHTDFITGTIIFKVDQTGSVRLHPMTKAQRNSLPDTPVTAGAMVFQSDNTPGLRMFNGTHWVRFTETNDD